MAIVYIRKVMILTLVLAALVFIPNASHVAAATSIHPTAIYEPAMSGPSTSTPSMPLPTPTPGYIFRPAPTSGVLRIAIIAAAFSDINYTVSTATIRSEYFGQNPSVASYYQEDSYGKVTLTGDVFGWYQLPYPEAHYGKDCLAIDDAGCDGQDASWQIAQDAYNIACKTVSFANYDYFVFLHAGNGEESSGVKDDVWSVTYLGGVYVRPTPPACSNDITLTKFNIVPEFEAGGAVPIGVYCHEFGHQLGLPDLYNTNTGQTILGPWSLMDKGLWNGNPPGSSPSHMDAWSKVQLQFMSGSMIATANAGVASTFTIDPTEVSSSNIHVVEVPLGSGSPPSKYYMIEARSAIGYDSGLPTTGVLILYVDTTQLVGKVRIINGHPSVSNLNGATWNVGQTFTDTTNDLSVTIAGQTGNSYQVSVNRGPGQPPPIQQQQNQTYIDLAITSVSAQPQVITVPNTTVTITVQISNQGTEAASNVPVEVDLDTQLYTNLQVSVGAGATTPATFTWVSTAGSHTFKITIDPKNTINNTNRANNVATFTLSVGPTLTINLPLNVTTAGNVWILINGAKYNITSSQFQTSVPNGTITVQIQPAVNTSQGVRQSFTGWSDGSTSNPRQITVTSGATLQALYATQYLLAINPNGGTTTVSGWYQPNATVTVSADNPSNVTANASRNLFSSWSGDLTSNSTTITVTMNKPVTLQANWLKQYYVTIISPTGTPTGQGWYNAGSVVTVGVQSTVQYSNGTRMTFNGWNSTTLGNKPTTQITVNSPTRLLAAWKTQYLVTVQSQYGTASGGGWYDAGSPVQISVPSAVDYTNATRRTFAGWTGDYTSPSNNVTLRVDTPKTLTAQWTTQYLITLSASGLPNSTILKLNFNNSSYDLPATSSYQAWVQSGASINPTLNQTIVSGITVYKFAGWRNSTGRIIQSPLAVNAPGTYVASYTNQLSLPAIPGFPIEGIVIGVVSGLLILAIRRKTYRQRESNETNRDLCSE
ncbi:MAG TPA: M6 family metalloprotease domain-containing protein [Candidatus Dormibacteraeota bacterium]|nr:M6 family metalloprotease domain-containing protein [Candidatus Dormibacteraeota bacterium]